MHRSEDDEVARDESPEFSDRQSIARDDRRAQERWIPGAPRGSQHTDASRGRDSEVRDREADDPGFDY